MKEKFKIAFDLDVATIKVWKEKRDRRREEVERFFETIEKYKSNFLVVVGKHTLDTIKKWKHKELVGRLEKLLSEYKIESAENLILEFCKKIGKRWKNILKIFVEEAKIKEEDAATVLTYSLLGVEYFVTLNKKHLRNKYALIKSICWKFGLNAPEIMLPSEFSLFFHRYFSNQISSNHPSDFSSNNKRISSAKKLPNFSSHIFSSIFPLHNINFIFKQFIRLKKSICTSIFNIKHLLLKEVEIYVPI